MDLKAREELLKRLDYLSAYFDFLKNPEGYRIDAFITLLMSVAEHPGIQEMMKGVPSIPAVGRPIFLHDTINDYVKNCYNLFFNTHDAIHNRRNLVKLRAAGMDIQRIPKYGVFFDLDTFYISIETDIPK